MKNSSKKVIKNGYKCRGVNAPVAAARLRPTPRFSSKRKKLKTVRRIWNVMLIDQKRINAFVNAVETKKGFERNPDKVFRHIVSEVGELDAKMFELEKLRKTLEGTRLNFEGLQLSLNRKIGEELLDIIFLACYMADLYQIDLNWIAPERMRQIRKQYEVLCPA